MFDGTRGQGDGSVRMTSEHLAQELGNGLSATDLVARAGVLASANDLLPAALLVEPGLVAVKRALTRTLGRPVGLVGSGPTLWTLYPSLAEAAGRGRGRTGSRRGRHDPVARRRTAIDHRHDHPDRTRGAQPMTRQAVSTTTAPAAVGPYSQAIVSGEFVFCSGQLGLDPATGSLVEGGVEAQAERALRNLAAVLDAAGLSIDDVVKTTVFLADIDDFAAVNAVYAPVHARSTARPHAPSRSGPCPRAASSRSRRSRYRR